MIMMQLRSYMELNSISPTCYTYPPDPYYDWLLDVYNIRISPKESKESKEKTYYYYLDTDGNSYFDSNNQLYVNERE